MSGRRLTTTVHVRGQVYGPGDDVPPEVAEKITNPHVWDDDPIAGPPVAASKSETAPAEPRRRSSRSKPGE